MHFDSVCKYKPTPIFSHFQYEIKRGCLIVLDLFSSCSLHSLWFLFTHAQAGMRHYLLLSYVNFLLSHASDEAVAAFLEASGGSLIELSLNNVEKVAA